MTVEQNLPAFHVVETRDQLDQRRLAAAGTTNNRSHRTGLRDEADVLQRRLGLARITRGDIAEFQLTLGTRQRHGAVIGLVGRVQHHEQTLRRRDAALGHVLHVGQLLERRNDGQHRHQHGNEITHRQAPGGSLMTGDEQQRGQANRTNQLHHSRRNAAGGFDLHRQAQVVVGEA
ncbi:hypothetical protein D3C71_1077300 [compost metagenome]